MVKTRKLKKPLLDRLSLDHPVIPRTLLSQINQEPTDLVPSLLTRLSEPRQTPAKSESSEASLRPLLQECEQVSYHESTLFQESFKNSNPDHGF